MKAAVLRALRFVVGISLVVMAALLVATQPTLHQMKTLLPFAFATLLIVLAFRYGIAVVLLGGPIAALIFAYFVYPPLGSFRVENPEARTNLGWMVFGALAVAYLLVPGPPAAHKK